MRTSILLASLLTLVIAAAWAQEPGTRVRVRDGATEITGTLLRFDADSVVVRADILNTRGKWVKEDMVFVLDADTKMDVSLARRTGGLKGAIIGGGVSLLVVGLPTAALAADLGDASLGGQVAAAAIPTAVGALLGYAIGQGSVTETWAEVPLDLPPPTDPQEITRGGVQLGFRVAF